jgi:hypothetical protein
MLVEYLVISDSPVPLTCSLRERHLLRLVDRVLQIVPLGIYF